MDSIKTLKKVSIPAGEPVLLCLCRNESLTLPALIEHHRRLGFSYFVFLDNGSDDGTQELLAASDGVTLLESKLPYKRHQNDFKQYLFQTYGMDRWGLLVDADEFFDFPGSEHLSLQSLISYLDQRGFNSLFTPLLDMFSDKPLQQLAEIEQAGFDRRHYPFCEIQSISRPPRHRLRASLLNRSFEAYTGGIRRSHFGLDCWLSKFALLKSSAGQTPYRTPHSISRRAKVADISGALLHYKFTSAFFSKIQSALAEKQYFQDSSEYRKYAQVLQDQPDFSLMTSDALAFTGLEALVPAGFGYTSKHFQKFLDQTRSQQSAPA